MLPPAPAAAAGRAGVARDHPSPGALFSRSARKLPREEGWSPTGRCIFRGRREECAGGRCGVRVGSGQRTVASVGGASGAGGAAAERLAAPAIYASRRALRIWRSTNSNRSTTSNQLKRSGMYRAVTRRVKRAASLRRCAGDVWKRNPSHSMITGVAS
jgi:hypothetical protein